MAAAKFKQKGASDDSSKANAPSEKSPQSEKQPKKEPRKPPKPPREVDPAMPWRPWTRVVLSLAIMYHVAAVFAAPWRLQTEPSLPPDFRATDDSGRTRLAEDADRQTPPFTNAISELFRVYQNATYLNHGYDFFSPNPAGNFVIGVVAFDKEGKQIGEEIYPDLKAQWPRLFYHRHMMLAAQGREFGDQWSRLYGRQMLKKFGAAKVHVSLNYHRLLTPQEVLDGQKLDDPSTYETLDEVDIYPEDKSKPDGKDNFRPIAPVRRNAPVKIPGVGP